MKWLKVLGWGITIYAIMYLAWSTLVVHGFATGIAPRVALIMVLFVVALTAGRSLKFHSWTDVLPYSFSWAVIAACLDALNGVPTVGWVLFADWRTWLGYAFIVILPLLAPATFRLTRTDS